MKRICLLLVITLGFSGASLDNEAKNISSINNIEPEVNSIDQINLIDSKVHKLDSLLLELKKCQNEK